MVTAFWRDEAGSALVTVLVLLTVLSLTTGSIMLVFVVRHRFIQRDVHRLEATYAAEAGLHAALAHLDADPGWRATGVSLDVPGGASSTLSVMAHGAYLRIVSTATIGSRQVKLEALVGSEAPGAFAHAVILGDPDGGLTLAGRSVVVGTVVVGPAGLQEGLLAGRLFEGRHEGGVEVTATPGLPAFDASILTETRLALESALQGVRTIEDLPTLFLEGDAVVTESTVLASPVRVVSSGSLTVTCRCTAATGTQFLSGGGLIVDGELEGDDLLLFARSGIRVGGGAAFSGQVLSDGPIVLSDRAHLLYPSALLTERGTIAVAATAVVDGTIVHAGPLGSAAGIVIDEGAVVRGAVYTTGRAEIAGTVYGTVAAGQLHFYESPTDFVNWLRDARIDVRRRPDPFVVPAGFGGHFEVAALRETYAEVERS